MIYFSTLTLMNSNFASFAITKKDGIIYPDPLVWTHTTSIWTHHYSFIIICIKLIQCSQLPAWARRFEGIFSGMELVGRFPLELVPVSISDDEEGSVFTMTLLLKVSPRSTWKRLALPDASIILKFEILLQSNPVCQEKKALLKILVPCDNNPNLNSQRVTTALPEIP